MKKIVGRKAAWPLTPHKNAKMFYFCYLGLFKQELGFFVASTIMPRKKAIISCTATSPSPPSTSPRTAPPSPPCPSYAPSSPTHSPRTSRKLLRSEEHRRNVGALCSWTVENDTLLSTVLKPESIGLQAFAPNYSRVQKRKLGCLCDPESEKNTSFNGSLYTGEKFM